MRFQTKSKYLSSEEVHKSMVLTITAVKLESIARAGEPSEEKFVLYFKEQPKGLILNVTNGRALAKAYGTDEMDNWLGRRLSLSAVDVEFKGDIVRGLRVKAVSREGRRK